MSHQHSHHTLLQELAEQLQPVLEESAQAIYVYLDDTEKLCNERFATLLGYGSAEEWAKTEGNFPDLFVDDGSQDALIGAYQKAMQEMSASSIEVRWKKKGGGTADTSVILVPVSHKGHVFALHFVA